MICQFHFCVYTQKNWKQGLKEIFVYILFIYSPLLAFVNNAPMNISVQIYESIYMLNSKVASLPKEQCFHFSGTILIRLSSFWLILRINPLDFFGILTYKSNFLCQTVQHKALHSFMGWYLRLLSLSKALL